ncbi:MAG: CDP-glucose 4,6-dehydratase [Candidatus Marinimicrobia bacterium]|jgi:CDP-glucose 4,6-dehydratase|nr:CDP-glucose 4,6-dehydratase [Candidatus Neomarinimicrobiota bacterium]MBT3633479.1 CDP-glucose 4,6-dehydratase [Candidatus Neomarinimicrobiota bacterium]MBT3681621.1 CDP-glucose 4,6-dehydratase [Candidatus Neomarinimicrobiota bacterium]MBT3758411.1 CDP-glucose 4,6-dehydratase [Candidatus Neomarinimicrobiota bacterium]MBT3894935.1 CDP-glucose 4,6-dehydratase [Candidatus Neomarinimicrobiota bacterium]
MTELKSYFNNKNVLVTGHTGFKGSWLSLFLNKFGAKVTGISLEPHTLKDNFVLCELDYFVDHHIIDLREKQKLSRLYNNLSPDIVFHLAAQPLVRYSYDHPLETFDVNINGTLNILECARSHAKPVDIIVVTSDKCYENKEWAWGYREIDTLGGHDPYSASKSAVEIICNSYRSSFFSDYINPLTRITLATARAGNVIGGGDWQTDRIVPDCIKSIEDDRPIIVRNPNSIRPWQHVLEPIYGYMLLAMHLNINPLKYASAWNFGPENSNYKTVSKLVNQLISDYGKGSWNESSKPHNKPETGRLKLDNTKSVSHLGWLPTWGFNTTVRKTVEWYKNYKSSNMFRLATDQIDNYISTIENQNPFN